MRLETERLTLREYHEHEVERLATIGNDWEIGKWMVALPYPYTIQDAQSWIIHVRAAHAVGNPRMFAVALKDNDLLIGGCGLDGFYDGVGEPVGIGYWLGRDYQGKGYGTEAARAMVRYGFDVLGLDRVVSTANIANRPSHNVLIKAGLKHVGTLERAEPTREGNTKTVNAYCLTRQEYEGNDAGN